MHVDMLQEQQQIKVSNCDIFNLEESTFATLSVEHYQ